MQQQLQLNVPELWGGLECTINRVQNRFFDQLASAGHYQRQGDIALLAGTGIKKVRYPLLWEAHQPKKDGPIDWRWATTRLQEWQQHGVEVIAGLVHHGSGPAYTSLADPQFPYLLADYAQKVVQQFPHLQYFTPVNEPLTTARFSGLYGLWYPHQTGDRHFLKMLLNEMKAVVLSMQAIRRINPAAKLVQTEDLGKTYSTPHLQYQADFENERRWLTYDLLCGKVTRDHPLWHYLISQHIREEELAFFEENVCVPEVFGFNHYLTSERFLDERMHRYPPHTHGGNGRHAYADVEAVRVELTEPSGLSVLLREAWLRYQRPMAITEVHLHCHREEQLRWFEHVWDSATKLTSEGVQLKAVTAWAMLGSYGWSKLLTEPGGTYEPGVFDVRNGAPRPTALAAYLQRLPGKQATHPVSGGKGWWHRPNRFLYGPRHAPGEVLSECGAPLLIIGRNGTLGRAFAKICKERFLPYKLLGRDQCNLCDLASIEQAVETYRPWAIVNAAGFVRVDDAEQEVEKCFADNATGPQNLAFVAARAGIRMVTFSSDLVFDGQQSTPYTESSATNPLNIYGLSKVQAEEAVKNTYPEALVIRTSAFFSPWDVYNFAHYVQQNLQNGISIPVASDAVISPTYVPDLVHATLDLLIDEEKGIWHLANNGAITWAGFAEELAGRLQLNRHLLQSLPTSEFRYPARRPLYSVLTSQRGLLLPSLEDALQRYADEIRAQVHKQIQACTVQA